MGENAYSIQEDRKLDALLTAEEVSELLKLPRASVVRYVRIGRIPAIRICNQWRFRQSSIEKWLDDEERGITGGSLQNTKPKKDNVGRVIDIAKRQKV
jgi:excisionase family DNA binding protein